MRYQWYLRTPEWKRTRTAALSRAGNTCSLDVTHTEKLEVHHRTYERLGAELVTDLVVLCHACHQLHHQEHGLLSEERHEDPLPPPTVTEPNMRSSRPRKRWWLSLFRRPFPS